MALEELSFESVNGRTTGRTDGWMDDGQKVITIAHPEHSSGELKITRHPAFGNRLIQRVIVEKSI